MTSPSGRIAGLDGLRAIAIVLVVAFHVAPLTVPGGYLGVDVFFVVSGFILTVILIRSPTNARLMPAVRRFWARRARRLVPALVAVLVLVSLAAGVIGGDVLVGIGAELLGGFTFTSNWVEMLRARDYFAASAPELFGNLWSLAIEGQFSFVWPIIVLALRRRPRIGLLVTLTAAAGSWTWNLVRASTGAGADAYLGTGSHSFGLLLGAAAAFALASMRRTPRSRRWAVVPLVILGGMLVTIVVSARGASGVERAFSMGGVALITAVLLIILTTIGTTSARWLDTRPLAWLGERSYGLYLWHLPLIVLSDALVVPLPQIGHLLNRVAAILVAVVLAMLSYRFLETPVRTYGFRELWRRCAAQVSHRGGSLILATGAIATAVTLAIVVACAPALTSTEQRLRDMQACLESDAAAASECPP